MDNKYKNGKIYTIRNRNDDALICWFNCPAVI